MYTLTAEQIEKIKDMSLEKLIDDRQRSLEKINNVKKCKNELIICLSKYKDDYGMFSFLDSSRVKMIRIIDNIIEDDLKWLKRIEEYLEITEAAIEYKKNLI